MQKCTNLWLNYTAHFVNDARINTVKPEFLSYKVTKHGLRK
ncbi:hypothetical protein FACS189491_12200 [Spirochaetia bacterium]|nr:hypothetical protein FACS189491_12200 [Spirochaetia bacterium]